jgi:hypothetical protein
MNKRRVVAFAVIVMAASGAWAAPVPLKCKFDNGTTERITVDAAALVVTMQSMTPGDDKVEFKDGATGPSLDHGGKAYADFVKVDDTQYSFGRYLCPLAKTLASLPCNDSYAVRAAINRLDGNMLLVVRDQKDLHGTCDKDEAQPKF